MITEIRAWTLTVSGVLMIVAGAVWTTTDDRGLLLILLGVAVAWVSTLLAVTDEDELPDDEPERTP